MTALLTEDVLDPAAFESENAASGAVVTFVGRVRDHDHGHGVVALEYSAHPSAAAVLDEIAAEVGADPDVLSLAVAHRLGTLKVGEVALVAVVATAHRDRAFALSARLVEEVKARLPVWKRQLFEDGTDEWVGAC